jgi:hypothetical protein
MAATTIEPGPNADDPPAAKTKSEATAAMATPVGRRTFWRAVVRTGGQVSASRERDRVEWHLAGCESPRGAGSHCSEGEHLIETVGHPDGHCIIDGTCGLCGAPKRESSD